MVQYALVAVKSKKQPYFTIKYGLIKKRRGRKKTIIAIARMIIVYIYHIVSEKKAFSPTDYENLIESHNYIEHIILNETNVTVFLVVRGYDTSNLVKYNDI